MTAPARTWEFIQSSRAWYHFASASVYRQDHIIEEIQVHQCTDGDLDFEFMIVWKDLGRPTPQVTLFHDSWRAFTDMRPLFDALADRDNLTVTECIDLLTDLFDATDVTETVNFNQAREPQDWMIVAAGQVLAAGSEAQMRSAFDSMSAGHPVEGMLTTPAGATVGLVHVEALTATTPAVPVG